MSVLAFPHSTRPSVLVLNDCPDTVGLLAAALRASGFRVFGETAPEFQHRVETMGFPSIGFSPDVVVYDIGRGSDEDWTHLRRLTELPGVEGKPLIITTTNVMKVNDGQRDAVYVRSRLEFLSTPHDLGDLVARVSAAIGLEALDGPGSAPPGATAVARGADRGS